MNTKTHINCACGQRVVARDVLTTGYLLNPVSQVYVFVKFRCPRCKKLGQEVVNRESWNWAALEDNAVEASAEEKQRFEELGPIQLDEAVEFHCLLEDTPRLEA